MTKRYAILIPLAGISEEPERCLAAVKRNLEEESEWVFSGNAVTEEALKSMSKVARLISREDK